MNSLVGYTSLSALLAFGTSIGRAQSFHDLGNESVNTLRVLSRDGYAIAGQDRGGYVDAYAYRWTSEGGRHFLGHLGGNGSGVLALSADGATIAGWSHTKSFEDWAWDPNAGFRHAFRWTALDGMRDIHKWSYATSGATDISADGSVVVGWLNTGEQRDSLFRWTKETGTQDLGLLGPGTHPTEERNVLVSGDGSTLTSFLYLPTESIRVFRMRNGGTPEILPMLEGDCMKPLAISFDGSVIAGIFHAGGERAFLWRSGSSEDLGPASEKRLLLSEDGSAVAGVYPGPDGGIRAFRWTADGGREDIPGGQSSAKLEVTGISPDGSLLAINSHFGTTSRAYLWMNGVGMLGLTEVFRAQGIADWDITQVLGLAMQGNAIHLMGIGFDRKGTGNESGWHATLVDPCDPNDVFHEADEQLVMEAEHFTQASVRNDPNQAIWQVGSTITGASGVGYLETALPQGSIAVWANACESSYRVNLTSEQPHVVWLRRHATGTTQNSVWVGLDGIPTNGLDNAENYGVWTWARLGIIRPKEAGLHTLQLRRREAGYKVDRILLTTDTRFTPSGYGPPESLHGTFKETYGLVVMEAEHFHASDPRSDPEGSWVTQMYWGGTVGRAAVFAPGFSEPAANWTDGSELTYRINYSSPGPRFVWLRRRAFSENTNSVFAAHDYKPTGLVDDGSNFETWTWVNLGYIEVMSAGIHTFQLRRREPRYAVDRIVLSSNPNYVPAGEGPPERW